MNDDVDYKIESLKFTFLEHARKAEQHRIEDISTYKKNFPDSSLPDHLIGPYFSISRALSTICDEIVKLKEENERRVR